MREVSSCTTRRKPTRPRLHSKRSTSQQSNPQGSEDGKSADHDQRRIRTSSIQRSELLCRENRNLLIVKFVPVVIVVIDRLLVRSSRLASFGMKDALLNKSDVVTGIRRGAFVGDYRCPDVVRGSEDKISG